MSNQLKKLSIESYEGLVGDIFGDSLHPGGLKSTAHMVEAAKIDKESVVLDVACGKGASAKYILERVECEVVGMDLSTRLLRMGRSALTEKTSNKSLQFTVGDAEFMPFSDSCFDVVMCECAFNLFPDKRKVLSEIQRVLKRGGTLVLADIMLKREMPPEMKTRLTFALCVGGAETLQSFCELLEEAGFVDIQVEDHSEKLIELGLELFLGNFPIEASNLDVEENEILMKLFSEDILCYALLVAFKPSKQ